MSDAHARLIAVAGQLVRGDGRPSEFAEDYQGRKTLSVNVVARMMAKLADRDRDMAVIIKRAADDLRTAAAPEDRAP